MSDIDELTDLLRTASRTVGDEVRADPGPLILRARRRRRRHRVLGVCAVAAMSLAGVAAAPLVLDGKTDDVDVAAGPADAPAEPFWSQPPAAGWTRLPPSPLSPRSGAVSAWTGSEIVVMGGATECGSADSCVAVFSDEPSTFEGAAFDPRAGTWRSIAAAPAPVLAEVTRVVAVDGDLYVLTYCGEPSASCDGVSLGLLRYRPADDAWDVLPGPPEGQNFGMVAAGDALVAWATSDDPSARTDWRFDLTSGSWSELPKDPLPQVINREMVADGDDVVLFATPGGPGSTATVNEMVAARLEISTGRWRTLPAAPGTGFDDSVIDGVAIPRSGVPPGAGGIFDPAGERWRPLPPLASVPGTPGNWRSGVVGVLRRTTSRFTAASGSVLDIDAGTWVQLPQLDERIPGSASLTGVGRRLFLFGGARPTGGGQVLNDAWVWTPPAGPEGGPQAGAPVTSAPPTTSTPTSAPPRSTAPPPPSALSPTTAPPPPPQAVPGAPVFVSASADAAAGRITVRFDRPVVGGRAEDVAPGQDPETLAAMRLIVFGSDASCSSPQGNAHDYLAGVGTDTITTDATSLRAGRTYIGIAEGFVKSAADGTPNATVVIEGARRSAIFQGLSCIPIEVSGVAPPGPP